jgi:probable rRNA maturation factor
MDPEGSSGSSHEPGGDRLVIYETRPRWLKPRRLEEFAHELSSKVARGGRFTCLIARDESVKRLNRDFRKQDESTDVLSFPSQAGLGLLGDIAISAKRAAEQAREHAHDPEMEVRILMLHGVLHLLGYDHEADDGQMRRVEALWRKKLGLTDGLIERAGRR